MELPFAVSEEEPPSPPSPLGGGYGQPQRPYAESAHPPQRPQNYGGATPPPSHPPASFDDDFTHVSVVYEESDDDRNHHSYPEDDDDDEILIDATVHNDTALGGLHQGGDTLTVLLRDEPFVVQTETASQLALKASVAKQTGDLPEALEYHMQAAKIYQSIANKVKDRNASMANSMLLLSQSQIKSAMVLKKIVRLSPEDLERVMPATSKSSSPSVSRKSSQKDRLRAAVRGALGSRREADLSDSMFLGPAKTTVEETREAASSEKASEEKEKTPSSQAVNPVDDMMELERELRDMDMALDLGNSIGSLDAMVHNRMHKTSGANIDGSFMVVPPGSNSYMSSSSMWGGASHLPSQQPLGSSRMADVRARANRVQSKVSKSQHGGAIGSQLISPPMSQQGVNNSLESSWWGNPGGSSASIMASSILSVDGNSRGILTTGTSSIGVGGVSSGAADSASTKQLMRLMDALKTLGDENASLLREVEDAEVARAEAKAAKAQMRRFQSEYNKRFASLKSSLEKFRKEHAAGNVAPSTANVVNNSNFVRNASVSDQLQRQEQLIRKLTFDLKKEKEESKKKDAALRKYESFYREVKARSAQKAAQRQQQQQQQPNLRRPARTPAMRLPH